MNTDQAEAINIEGNLAISIAKLSKLEKGLILAITADQQFALEYQIEEEKKRIRDFKDRLAGLYNINAPSGEELLKEKVRLLHLNTDIGVIYLVNCNRTDLVSEFWEEFDKRSSYNFQFYFINGCIYQNATSFGERLIHELVLEKLKNDRKRIFYSEHDDGRIKSYDLPLSLTGLEDSKQKFYDFFSDQFSIDRKVTLDEFLKKGLPELDKYGFVILIFRIYEHKWSKKFMNNYLRWIISMFIPITHTNTKFIFFFTFIAEGLYLDNLTSEKIEILDSLQQITQDYPSACYFPPLPQVKASDVKTWLMERGEDDIFKIEAVLEVLVKGLKETDRQQYENKKLLNMSDVERLQKIVFQIIDKR